MTANLQTTLKEYRIRAENRIMSTSDWTITHRLKLKSIVDKMFDLQVELNEL